MKIVSNHVESRAVEIETLGKEWAAAELSGDTAFLGSTLAEDFVGVSPPVTRSPRISSTSTPAGA